MISIDIQLSPEQREHIRSGANTLTITTKQARYIRAKLTSTSGAKPGPKITYISCPFDGRHKITLTNWRVHVRDCPTRLKKEAAAQAATLSIPTHPDLTRNQDLQP